VGKDRGRAGDDGALGACRCGDGESGARLAEPGLVGQEAARLAEQLLGPRALKTVEVEPEPARHLGGRHRYRQGLLGYDPFDRLAVGADHRETGRLERARG
jgi:hypothetical protein